jgi:putative transposase
LGVAYKNFFDSLKGKRKGKKVGSPKFKKKTGRQSARFRIGGFSINPSASLRVKGEEVYLAKIGNIKPISPVSFTLRVRKFRLDGNRQDSNLLTVCT